MTTSDGMGVGPIPASKMGRKLPDAIQHSTFVALLFLIGIKLHGKNLPKGFFFVHKYSWVLVFDQLIP